MPFAATPALYEINFKDFRSRLVLCKYDKMTRQITKGKASSKGSRRIQLRIVAASAYSELSTPAPAQKNTHGSTTDTQGYGV